MCTHFWNIESQNGRTSKGVCKLCGDARMFLSFGGYCETLTFKELRTIEHMRALKLNEEREDVESSPSFVSLCL